MNFVIECKINIYKCHPQPQYNPGTFVSRVCDAHEFVRFSLFTGRCIQIGTKKLHLVFQFLLVHQIKIYVFLTCLDPGGQLCGQKRRVHLLG